MPYGITEYYLLPGRGDIPAFAPAEAGTRLLKTVYRTNLLFHRPNQITGDFLPRPLFPTHVLVYACAVDSYENRTIFNIFN